MESTLSLKKTDLEGSVGLFLGYGRGADNSDTTWTTRQQTAIEEAVKSGLRQFYFPPPMDGVVYDWSFLKPTVSLTLASGAEVVALPDDCGGIEGEITLSTSSSQVYRPLPIVSDAMVRREYSRFPSTTGAPQLIACRPLKGTQTTKGQRF